MYIPDIEGTLKSPEAETGNATGNELDPFMRVEESKKGGSNKDTDATSRAREVTPKNKKN